jgi:UPF0755 protein
MSKRLIIFIFAAPLFGVLLAAAKVYYTIQVWTYQGPTTTFEIRRGESFSKLNYRLSQRKLINSSRVFHRYCQVNGLIKKFKTGVYEINPDSNMVDIIGILTSGSGVTTSITIPEGKNLYEIGKILEKKGITTYEQFVSLAKSEDFALKLNIQASTLEGYLYPDTYRFIPNTPASQVITSMVSTFKKKTGSLDLSSTKLSPHELITLASMVEKETGASWERPRIAGVFYNRLKKGMRLQSDPTTIYGIYENFNGNLRKKHLLAYTPYNTYKIKGLPIGPIANPGIKAIEAVLKPESHNYLYFVSKNDGTHIFSPNYKLHRQAVDKWQKNRANRKGKSWRQLRSSN